MILDSINGLNDTYKRIKEFLGSENVSLTLAADTRGRADPYDELLTGLIAEKSQGPILVTLTENRGLKITGSVKGHSWVKGHKVGKGSRVKGQVLQYNISYRMLGFVFRLVFGSLAVLISLSIIVWVLYNYLVERQPQFTGPRIFSGFGIALPMLSMGIYWLRNLRDRSAKQHIGETASEVADIIERFIEGKGSDWEWDDFISLSIQDPTLDKIRVRCLQLDKEFPPAGPSQYTNENGLKVLREYVRQLREMK